MTLKPSQIILVRHAQSAANIDKEIYQSCPDHAFALTPTGHEQAAKAAFALKNQLQNQAVFAYISPYRRTRETYQQLLTTIKDNVQQQFEDPRLREQALGHWQSAATFAQNLQKCEDYGRFYYQLPEGESTADVYQRACGFLETLWRDFAAPNAPQTALIVSHGITIRVLVMALLRERVEFFEQLNNPENCQIITLKAQGTGYQLQTPLAPRPPNAKSY